ncbi:hypothetical protein AAW14_36510 [Streptomyces hygroscopicus]|uniref:hypothetical protein n=1 Tax=Streptomyces hygroscopicus TaxID=1912 RepID=UPI00223F45D5|nr:hypothetical protein [Streptomyces hygroscopicus]MCW7947306.1 hypothetical protein [Streptomyces hygroscopicus]
MDDSLLEVRLTFEDLDGADIAERDMEFLFEELDGLEVPYGRLSEAPAPAGTRAGDVSTYTSLVLGLAGAPALRALIRLAQDWLARRNSGSIDLKLGDDELHMTSVSRADQQRAVEAFIARAAERSSDA